MTNEIISWPISMKVCDQAGIQFATTRPAIRLSTDCAMGPGIVECIQILICNTTTTLMAIASQIQALIKSCNMPQTLSKSME